MQLTIYTYFQCSVHKGLTLNGTLQIDYVLFVTVPSKDLITIRPHPDEVDDVRWVTQDTLLAMFAVVLSNCRWMIGKGGWWNDLDQTMTIDDFCDYINIHRFDPPDEHLGNAGPLFGKGRTNLVEKIQSANL